MATYQLSSATVVRATQRNRQLYKFLLEDLACCDWGTSEQIQQLQSQFTAYLQKTNLFVVESIETQRVAAVPSISEYVDCLQEAFIVNQKLISKAHACEGHLLMMQEWDSSLPECLARKIYIDFPELCDVEPLSYQPLTVLCDVIRKHYDLHSAQDFQDAKRHLNKYLWSRKEAEQRQASYSSLANDPTLVAEPTRASKVPATDQSADVLSVLDGFLTPGYSKSRSPDVTENKKNEKEKAFEDIESLLCAAFVSKERVRMPPVNVVKEKELVRDYVAEAKRALEEHMMSKCKISANDLVKSTEEEDAIMGESLKESCHDDNRSNLNELMDRIRRKHYEREALSEQASITKSSVKLAAPKFKKDKGELPCKEAQSDMAVELSTLGFQPVAIDTQQNPADEACRAVSDTSKTAFKQKDSEKNLIVKVDNQTCNPKTANTQTKAHDARLMPPPKSTVVKRAKLHVTKRKHIALKPSEPNTVTAQLTSCQESLHGNRKRRFEHSSRQNPGVKDRICLVEEIAVKRQKSMESLAEIRARVSSSLNNQITKELQKSMSSKYFKPEGKYPQKVPAVSLVKTKIENEVKPATVSRQTSFVKSAASARQRHKYGKPPILLKIYKDETGSLTSEVNLI